MLFTGHGLKVVFMADPAIGNLIDNQIVFSLKMGLNPDEPIGIPSDQPARWMAVGIAMAILENDTDSLDRSTLVALLLGDNFAMLRGWGLAREPLK